MAFGLPEFGSNQFPCYAGSGYVRAAGFSGNKFLLDRICSGYEGPVFSNYVEGLLS